MKLRLLRWALPLLGLPLLSSCWADAAPRPFLCPLFTDNMVLQRGLSDAVWGWTRPGVAVRVRVAGKEASAVTGADGQWTAHLPPLPVGGPYTLTVTGPQTQTLNNVLVGDVWICSGQSNMEFGIGNTNNAAQEIAHANYPKMRLYMVAHNIALTPQSAVSGQWLPCRPDTVTQGGWNGFSAVGYFFGRELNQTLHIPIGLIETNWGGTPAEAWTSERALQTMPDFQAQLTKLDQDKAGGYDFASVLAAWWERNDPGVAQAPGWASPAYDASAWKTMALPQYWEGAGDPALSNFDGILWYRKEVILSADAAGKAAMLHLGPVDDDDSTFVNGVPVGTTQGYQTPRDYAVPANVLKAGRNVIAVRVLDTGGGGGLWGKPADMRLDVIGQLPLPLAGTWSYQIGKPLAQTTALPQDIQSNPSFPSVL